MKILIVNPAFWIYGGAEELIVNLCNYLTDRHHQVTIITQMMVDDVRKDLKETRLLFCRDLKEMAISLTQIASDFDIINVHNHPCEYMLNRKLNIIWQCNEPDPEVVIGKELVEEKKVIVNNFIKKIIVSNELDKQRIKKFYDMDAEVIRYGFNQEFFNKGSDKILKELELDKKDFIISQVGFIHETKNQLRTLKIFKEVKKRIPNAKLVLAGKQTEPYMDEIRDFVTKNNLMHDVILAGLLSREKLKDLYFVSKYYLFPSLTQGGWLSVMEALASGCNVMVSKEMTASGFLKDNDLGYVFDTNEEAVNYITRTTKFDMKSQKNDLNILKKYSWDLYSENMLNKFKEILK